MCAERRLQITSILGRGVAVSVAEVEAVVEGGVEVGAELAWAWAASSFGEVLP